jgi:hypothetical protein
MGHYVYSTTCTEGVGWRSGYCSALLVGRSWDQKGNLNCMIEVHVSCDIETCLVCVTEVQLGCNLQV